MSRISITKAVFIFLMLGATLGFVSTSFIVYEKLTSKEISMYKSLMEQDKDSMEKFVQAEITRHQLLAEEQAVKKLLDNYNLVSEVQANNKSVYGNTDARYTMVVYSDMECPYCKRFHSSMKSFIQSSKGLVNWEFMHFPLDFHNPAAQIEAVASECVKSVKGNKAYWAFIDTVFAKSKGNGGGVDDLRAVAKSVGSENEEFLQCVAQAKPASTLETHYQTGIKLGVNSTPFTVIVDNSTGRYTSVRGALDEKAMFDALKQFSETKND